MSTTGQKQLGSVARWVGTLLGNFIANTLVVGFLVTVASSPALLVLPHISDLSASFGWLAVVGVFLPFLNPSLDEDDVELLTDLMENIEDATRVEMFLYAVSFLLVLIAALSVLVLFAGVVAASLTSWTNIGLLGVGFAVFYPYIDIWAGNSLGWNIASIGGALAVGVLYLAAFGYRTSPTVPREAAMDAQSFILSH